MRALRRLTGITGLTGATALRALRVLRALRALQAWLFHTRGLCKPWLLTGFTRFAVRPYGPYEPKQSYGPVLH